MDQDRSQLWRFHRNKLMSWQGGGKEFAHLKEIMPRGNLDETKLYIIGALFQNLSIRYGFLPLPGQNA